MITIDQLLESVYLDFEPRFVTKDEDGNVWIWNTRPYKNVNWRLRTGAPKQFRGSFISGRLKLAEFDGKDWTECIYEVPRKTIGKTEKIKFITSFDILENYAGDQTVSAIGGRELADKINEIIDWINNNYKDAK